MNKHFEDTRYYLARAMETAAKGVREELEPVEERIRELTGREPEPGRFEAVWAKLEKLQQRAISEVREKITEYRKSLA